MALPRMDSDPTAVDRLASGGRVTPVTPMTSVAAAQACLRAGEAATVVLDGNRPLGVVTAAALARALTEEDREAPVAMIMDYVAVPVDPLLDAYETITTFQRAAWDWLERRGRS